MDLQAMINAINAQMKEGRSGYHLTLGQLKSALEKAPENIPVVFEDGSGAGDLDSYRGYYCDIAIDAGSKKLLSWWRDRVEKALVEVFIGYKGGEYPADTDTPLWRSEYGIASGTAIMDVDVRDDAFVLVTKQIED